MEFRARELARPMSCSAARRALSIGGSRKNRSLARRVKQFDHLIPPVLFRRITNGPKPSPAAIDCGTTTLYDLINKGLLEARRLGHRTYITAESLEAFVASLKPVVTPTMAKAKQNRLSRHRGPRPKPKQDGPGPA